MDTEARTLSHSDIAWGESGEAAYGRKRTAFLRALRSHRLVVEHPRCDPGAVDAGRCARNVHGRLGGRVGRRLIPSVP